MTENSASEQSTASEQAPEECGGIFSAVKGMFSFFTMLPINIGMKEMNAMNRKFWLVPIIGVFYGLLALLVFTVIDHYTSTLLAAVCALFTVQMFNRFLHLDGMIDIGDGLTVAGKREDHLRALKDTRIGAGGMATGLFVTLVTVAAMAATGSAEMFLFVGVSCEILARVGQISAAAFGIPGNGMAGDSVRYTGMSGLVLALILAVAFVAAVFAAGGYSLGFDWYAFDACCIAAGICIITAVFWGFVMSRIAKRNFGMVNGDVLGATNESTRAILLIVSLIVVSVIA
jgi:adenosylcobinamide-GDP ribazoletransferase